MKILSLPVWFSLLALASAPASFASPLCNQFLESSIPVRKTLYNDLYKKFDGVWQLDSTIHGSDSNGLYSLRSLPEKLTIEAYGNDLEDGRFDLGLRFKSSRSYFFGRINEGYQVVPGAFKPNLSYGYPPYRAYAEMENESYDGISLTKTHFAAYGPHWPLGYVVPARFWQYVQPYAKEVVTITPSQDRTMLVFEIKFSGSSYHGKGGSGRVVYRRVQ